MLKVNLEEIITKHTDYLETLKTLAELNKKPKPKNMSWDEWIKEKNSAQYWHERVVRYLIQDNELKGNDAMIRRQKWLLEWAERSLKKQ